jgi:hypothetical protein
MLSRAERPGQSSEPRDQGRKLTPTLKYRAPSALPEAQGRHDTVVQRRRNEGPHLLVEHDLA